MAQLVDLVNRAFGRIGAARISVLAPETSPAAAMALELAQPRLDALLQESKPPFARQWRQLTEIAEAMPGGTPFTNQFTVPTDCLAFLATDSPSEEWEIHAQPGGAERRVYLMRAGPVYANMVLRIECALYTPMFEQAATAALAAEFAMPITRDAVMADYWEKRASALLSLATVHGWNEQPWPEIPDGDYLSRARYGG